MPLTLAEFTADLFAAYVGQTFFFGPVAAPDFATTCLETAAMRLVQVNRYSGGGEPERAGHARQPFSLWFEAVNGPPPRGLCRLTHQDFGTWELFLSRISIPGRNQSTAVYEAVFN